ncbi:hypothetical protein [Herpetosiphon sp. NSE202]|uniref:hypothetical protein n=1 Tax=Herpetosiphon sp. NSE202 TaxID=3351349 RepID=UPI00362C7D0B
MLRKWISASIGGSILILVLLMVFDSFRSYVVLGPIDDFPIYADSSSLLHNGQAVHYVVLKRHVNNEIKDFYIKALAQRDWHLQPALSKHPNRLMRFEHSSIKGVIELSISEHGRCKLARSEVYARYVDPRLPITPNPNKHVVWHGTRLLCTEAQPLSAKSLSPS